MGEFLSLLKDDFPPRISVPLILLIILLTGTLPFPPENYMPDALQNQLSKTPTIRWATTLFLSILLLSISYLHLYRAYRNKLKPKFGVKWDKNKQAYYPTCESLLTRYSPYKNDSGEIVHYYFQCMKCKSSVYIKDDSGSYLTLKDAQKQP